jgi:putative PIN family toxin of toxin-antitoxin system
MIRAVYDTMVFVQWASLPAGRQHATIKALYDGSVRLCLSQDAIDEIRDVLPRPELAAQLPRLTAERVAQIIEATVQLAEWVDLVPNVFSWPHHPDDDHLFNLAIAAKAERLVTFEDRVLSMKQKFPEDAERLRLLAPSLSIITPKELAEELKSNQAPER